MRWTKRVALAVATGALSDRQGKTVLAAIESWRKAYAQNVTAQQIVEAWLAKKGEGR